MLKGNYLFPDAAAAMLWAEAQPDGPGWRSTVHCSCIIL